MATILIVDDPSANRRPLVTLLRPRGHRLLEAADGRGGLKPGIAFLHKPFTSDTLGWKIREVLDRSASVCAAERLPDTGSPADDAQQKPLPGGRE